MIRRNAPPQACQNKKIVNSINNTFSAIPSWGHPYHRYTHNKIIFLKIAQGQRILGLLLGILYGLPQQTICMIRRNAPPRACQNKKIVNSIGNTFSAIPSSWGHPYHRYIHNEIIFKKFAQGQHISGLLLDTLRV